MVRSLWISHRQLLSSIVWKQHRLSSTTFRCGETQCFSSVSALVPSMRWETFVNCTEHNNKCYIFCEEDKILCEPSHMLKFSYFTYGTSSCFFLHTLNLLLFSFLSLKITFWILFCLYFPPPLFPSILWFLRDPCVNFLATIRQHLYNSHCMKLNRINEKHPLNFGNSSLKAVHWVEFKKKMNLFSMLLKVSVLQGDNELNFIIVCLRTLPWFLVFHLYTERENSNKLLYPYTGY